MIRVVANSLTPSPRHSIGKESRSSRAWSVRVREKSRPMIPCNACGVRHNPLWRCSDPRIKRLTVAINASEVAQKVERGPVKSVVAGSTPALGAKTANRGRREDYNAYLKSYMRVRRAIKAGRACPWP